MSYNGLLLATLPLVYDWIYLLEHIEGTQLKILIVFQINFLAYLDKQLLDHLHQAPLFIGDMDDYIRPTNVPKGRFSMFRSHLVLEAYFIDG